MPHEEAAVGPRNAQRVAFLERFVQPAGARAAGHHAHVELDFLCVAALVRCIRNREGARLAERGNLHLHVLAGLVLNRRIELQVQRLDGRRELLDAQHLGGEVAHRDDLRVGLVLDVRFNHGIGLQGGAAGEGLAVVALHVHQRERVGRAVVHFALADLHFAGAAKTVATGMGDVDSLPQGGVQQGLSFFHFDGGAQRF